MVKDISERYKLEVDPDALIENLPVGIQQRVEIIKVLSREARYLVFDEPTAVLTPQEVEEFFQIVQSLREAGKGIIIISHNISHKQSAKTIQIFDGDAKEQFANKYRISLSLIRLLSEFIAHIVSEKHRNEWVWKI